MRLSAIRPIAIMIMKELAISALLLIGVSLVVFIIINLSPGNPFDILLEGQTASGLSGADVSKAMDIPESWHSRYLAWLANMFTGNFGTSIRTGMPVLSEIIRVGINTLYLTIGSMFITLIMAVPIAVFSARRGMTAINLGLTILAYVVSALPIFWLGYVVIYISMRKFGIFPLMGFASENSMGWVNFLLPIIVLGIGNGTISEVVRYLREEIERVLADDYIRTARAKGASIWRHSFKEGFLIPITEIIASKIPFILGGAVVVEQVFNWPGMGRMAWQAAQDRDYPLIMGITLMAAIFVRIGSLFQRVVYVVVNPRASQE